MPGLVKRSLIVAGHATSVALEPEFWAVLDRMTAKRRISTNTLISELDSRKGQSLLASYCRLSVLAFVQAEAPRWAYKNH